MHLFRMKILRPSLVGLTSIVLTVGACAESTQELLTAAQTAYMKGDLETAKKNFQAVNTADPKNQIAIGFLRKIAVEETKRPQTSTLQKQLQTLIVPKVEFREATFGSALEFMKQAAVKNSNGKVAVNFVVQLPEDQMKTLTVTLSLSNTPYSEVLRYLCDLANVDFTYDKFAIVVKPHVAAPATAPVAQ